MRSSLRASRSGAFCSFVGSSASKRSSAECGDDLLRVGDPAEDAALRLDHPETHFVEFGEVRTATIAGHDTAIAAVVRFADRRVDAHLCGYPAHDQVLDAAVL